MLCYMKWLAYPQDEIPPPPPSFVFPLFHPVLPSKHRCIELNAAMLCNSFKKIEEIRHICPFLFFHKQADIGVLYSSAPLTYQCEDFVSLE